MRLTGHVAAAKHAAEGRVHRHVQPIAKLAVAVRKLVEDDHSVVDRLEYLGEIQARTVEAAEHGVAVEVRLRSGNWFRRRRERFSLPREGTRSRR